MKKKSISFSTRKVDYYFDARIEDVERIADTSLIYLTDENVFKAQQAKFEGKRVIIMPAGEAHKNQSTVDGIIDQLITMNADRKTTLVGVGGGVVTDIAGFVASIYMRGINFGFVPTTILAMVDASIGGKNGIDVGAYKNLVGTINQPQFLVYDITLLESLPESQWINGFAEIIKHACIKDADMFNELSVSNIRSYRKDQKALLDLLMRNAMLKSRVVRKDEFEQGERRLLNFGHTIGHAIENEYALLHGHAISVGMIAASKLSEKLNGFRETKSVQRLLKRYGLPVNFDFDVEKAIHMLKLDKKKVSSTMNFILLDRIGKARVEAIPMDQLEVMIKHL